MRVLPANAWLSKGAGYLSDTWIAKTVTSANASHATCLFLFNRQVDDRYKLTFELTVSTVKQTTVDGNHLVNRSFLLPAMRHLIGATVSWCDE